MKKIFFIFTILVALSLNAYANDSKLNKFVNWLEDNNHTQYLEINKNYEDCKSCTRWSAGPNCFEEIGKPKKQCVLDGDQSYGEGGYKWAKIKKYKTNLNIKFYKYNEIPEFSKPNKDTALYYLYRGQEAASDNSRVGSTKSNNPYEFEISLRIDDDKTLKKVRKAMNKTSMLSYLLYEDGKITIDEITPLDRFGILYDNNTQHTSASVGKSLVSYVTGHAICEGYISGIDHKLNDWELLENTLFYDQNLINLLNMAAGHHKYADHNIKTGGLYPTNSNKNTIAFHMKDGVFENSKKSKSKYQYTNLLTSIVINYVWHKSDGNFQDLLDKVFKEKAKIENDVWFEKNNNKTVRQENRNNKIKKEYEVKDEDGPITYSFKATRYDYLRIAKAILDDWQNDTCVGKYLKDIHKRKIPKNHKYKDDKLANRNPKSYAGFFHTDYSGMTKRNVMGMNGYGGQAIVIDFDKGRIIVVNSITEDYSWKNLVHSVIKRAT